MKTRAIWWRARRKTAFAAEFFETDAEEATNMMAFDENDGFSPVEII